MFISTQKIKKTLKRLKSQQIDQCFSIICVMQNLFYATAILSNNGVRAQSWNYEWKQKVLVI